MVLINAPGSPIFIRKLAGQARHLELQLLADRYGNAISLFGRDCSVQHRHQKIIEEAPVTISRRGFRTDGEGGCSPVQTCRICQCWFRGIHAEDYFYFSELNPRLQVEHPTTEIMSGVNLPAAQLQIATGLPMHRIRDIRQLYGVAPNAPMSGATSPSPPLVDYTNLPITQFGHIFAYGEDRRESRKNMIAALKESSIRGDFRTTVVYLFKLLELEALKENTITTGWLDSLISSNLTAERPDATLAVIYSAVTKAYLASEACWTEYRCVLDKGQVPGRDVLKTVFGIDFIYENTRYSFTAARSSSTAWTLYLNGGRTMVGARALADGGLLVLLDGKSHSIYWREEVGALRLMLRSPSPGKVICFFVDSGDHINAGEQYAEIEVMKMYMPLVASEDGVVQLIKQPGVSLESGDILGILTLDDPARVKHARPFEGQLPAMGGPGVFGNQPHQRYIRCMTILNDILNHFDNQATMASTLKDVVGVLHEPELPYSEVDAILPFLDACWPSSKRVFDMPSTLRRPKATTTNSPPSE
ncbi:hypothetical protein FPV67DRAFT_1454673 [Lyophyllum atratum]|nr:hypothetical protein FPV67DRAFT_1454673 [Lyophyllum atratum]